MTEVGTLSFVTVADLRGAWPALRVRLEEIADRHGEHWIIEDVWHELLVGNAYFWATEDFGCFVILQVQATPYVRDLHVWIASEETAARAADYVPQLQAIAQEASCSRVTFETARRWDRALPDLTVRYHYSFDA